MLRAAIVGLITLVMGAPFLFLFAFLLARQARDRGYRFLPWLAAGMLGNAVFFLIMLAVMPDFAARRLRREYRAKLEKRLARLEAERAAAARPVPPAPPPRPALDRSLGDLPTQLPPDRSLGDAETHL